MLRLFHCEDMVIKGQGYLLIGKLECMKSLKLFLSIICPISKTTLLKRNSNIEINKIICTPITELNEF